jgi:parvulin-like peptidyl-prolyl isomerase
MSKKLKLFILICALALCVLPFTFTCFAEDKIIAIVNSDVITQKDLNDFIGFMRMQLSADFKGKALEEKIQSMKQDLLNRLIEDRLILQEAKKNNIRIDENRVKARISEVRGRYASDAEFKEDLAKHGLTQADMESRFREQLLMYEIVEQMVRSKIIVRPEEVTSFYNKNIKEFVSGEEREVETVALENDDLARIVSYELRTGIKLVDLAARYPLTVNKLNARKEELRKDIADVVFKLGVSEVSNPIKIDDKYYIFKLENIIPSRQLSLSEAQDKIYAFLFEKKMQEKLTKWLDEIRQKSYVKISQD